VNPISLLTTATADRIIDDPLARGLCVSMMEEAARIGAAIGIPVSSSIEKMIETIRALGAFNMSMLQDVEHGKPAEIDALLTVTHDIGQLVGVPTPFIDSVLGLARLRAISLGFLDRAASPEEKSNKQVAVLTVQPRSPAATVRASRARPNWRGPTISASLSLKWPVAVSAPTPAAVVPRSSSVLGG
jgi:hypothetical protein